MNSLSNFQIPDVWEVKDVVNKLKNVVLNYTEMEAKVHEATNNEPWGASSTLMQELAQGTYNYQYFNEIMPTVYRRFTEKESKQWRQIYKALVLLEYLIKNGSERVVDDARSHVSMIKVMRNFYYIDDKGKDEGLNVRNRAKEIVELLSSTEKIRSERKLAKKNRNKYTGVGSDGPRMGGYSGGSSSGSGFSAASSAVGAASRYMGFGSDSLGGLGGGRGGISFNGDAMTLGQPYASQQVGKYDEDGDGLYHSDSNNNSPKGKKGGFADDDDDEDDFMSSSSSQQKKKNTQQTNDDDWGDFAWGGASTEALTTKKASISIDDDFADFQHAVADEPIISTATTTTNTAAKKQDLFDLLGDDITTATSNTASPAYQFSALNSSSQPITPSGNHQQQLHQPQAQQQKVVQEESTTPAAATNTPTTGMWAQASNFVSLDSLGKKTNNTAPTKGPSMNSLKSTSVQADWNNWASNNQPQQQKPAAPANKTTSAFDDLLL